jgi:UDP-3-O-[3-hydroxymyristoyl] N-acetylglucosamine deacetylase / 3-hydroxyacyl-[acyl-carrier-protein] dehydratase
MVTMKQSTIQNPVSVRGVGLHTGKNVTLTFKPAEANHGYRFQRVDLPEQPVIPADVKLVISTNRGTTLKVGDAQVSTVEHVLSALIGTGVDNVLLEIDGPEMPIMDGTSMPFVKAILEAGLAPLDADREYYEVTEPISYKDEVTGTELLALPSDHFEATVMIDFNSSVLGQQFASLNNMSDYVQEIAPCRTFVFIHELEKLLDMGLIKGGDMDNAIVIADRRMEQEDLDNLAKKMGKPGIKVDAEGVLNTLKLHFQNEPARHKLLDVIGDLALIGKPIRGKIVATKPGHTANIEFAKILKKSLLEKRRLLGVPKYDPEKEPVLDINAVMQLLPHRYPFLLVDKIIEISDTHVVGVKNVTFNEGFFQGHFPSNPVFPGVLQIEALAQTGGILALNSMPDKGNWDTYFLKIDNAKFKAKVSPGDTIILKMELIEPIRRGIVHMQGTTYVGSKIVSEAELTAQVVRRVKEPAAPSASTNE